LGWYLQHHRAIRSAEDVCRHRLTITAAKYKLIAVEVNK
jgi:hypothetical protein